MGEQAASKGKVHYAGLALTLGAAAVIGACLLAPELLLGWGVPVHSWLFLVLVGAAGLLGGLMWESAPPGELPRELVEPAHRTTGSLLEPVGDTTPVVPPPGVVAFAVRAERAMWGSSLLAQVGLLEMGTAAALVAADRGALLLALLPLVSGWKGLQRVLRRICVYVVSPPGECDYGVELAHVEGRFYWNNLTGRGIFSVHEQGVYVAAALQGLDPLHQLAPFAQVLNAWVPFPAVAAGEHNRKGRRTQLSLRYLCAVGPRPHLDTIHFLPDKPGRELTDTVERAWLAARQRAAAGLGSASGE